MKTLLFISLIFFSFLNIAFAKTETLKNISPIEANKLIEEKKAVLVDVREESETRNGFAKGSLLLPKSKMDTDRKSFDKEISQIPKDKTIIVYCASGKRACVVGQEIEKEGYKVLNMQTFNSWKNAGLPIEIPKSR